MKGVLVFVLALIFLIPLARTVLAAPAVESVSTDATRLSFKGTMQSKETYSIISPTKFVTANGSGEVAGFGPFTVSYHVEVNLQDLSETGSAQFSGTNGNSLLAKGVGQAIEDRTPGMYNVVEIYTITGGTGRFEGARGTITVKRLVSVDVGLSTSTFEGYILLSSN